VRRRLGDPRVVPGFPCPSFLTCHPLRPRGDSHRFVPAMRSQHSFRHVMNASALPIFLQIRFTQGRHFGASLVRLCCGLSSCLPPVRNLTSFVAAEAFTSRLSTSRSPFSPLDMTTAVSGRFCRWDFHPLERQLVLLHHNKEGGSIKKKVQRACDLIPETWTPEGDDPVELQLRQNPSTSNSSAPESAWKFASQPRPVAERDSGTLTAVTSKRPNPRNYASAVTRQPRSVSWSAAPVAV
jgi:hypothetical protein